MEGCGGRGGMGKMEGGRVGVQGGGGGRGLGCVCACVSVC